MYSRDLFSYDGLRLASLLIVELFSVSLLSLIL